MEKVLLQGLNCLEIPAHGKQNVNFGEYKIDQCNVARGLLFEIVDKCCLSRMLNTLNEFQLRLCDVN